MKTIIFDMYGVIIKESKGNFIPYVYSRFPDTDKAYLISLFIQAQIGQISSAQFLKSLGFTDWEKAQAEYLSAMLTFDADFTRCIQRLRPFYRFALLSNDVSEWSRFLSQKYHLYDIMDVCIVSGDTGCKKPDIKIYGKALDILNCPAEDCIFIDNAVQNLLTARQVGMDVILFNRDNEEYAGKTVYSFDELTAMLTARPAVAL